MEKFDNLIKKLERSELKKEELEKCLSRLSKHFEIDIDIETLNFLGLPIREEADCIFLTTKKNHFKDEEYCVVDIETNGNSPIKNQIIELGAVKIKNGKITAKFESYVFADFIPPAITKITKIKKEDLKDAPSLKKVLQDFKLFLGDNVFVAHNVKFDYNFISNSLKVVGLEELLNRKLCTVDLSRKTINSPRHGLAFLRDFLKIEEGDHHRAYSDAHSASIVLQECFKNIPENINTTEDLIYFSKMNNKQKNKKPTASFD